MKHEIKNNLEITASYHTSTKLAVVSLTTWNGQLKSRIINKSYRNDF